MDANSELEKMKEILLNLSRTADNSNVAFEKIAGILSTMATSIHGFEERIAKLEAAVSKDRGIKSEEDLHG